MSTALILCLTANLVIPYKTIYTILLLDNFTKLNLQGFFLGFKLNLYHGWFIHQLVVHWTPDREVFGSNPIGGTI